jgi:hypothetical protein
MVGGAVSEKRAPRHGPWGNPLKRDDANSAVVAAGTWH